MARYGWNRRSGSLIIGAAVFVLLALTVPMSLALRVVTLVFFGGGGLVFIANIASRRVAPATNLRTHENRRSAPVSPRCRLGHGSCISGCSVLL